MFRSGDSSAALFILVEGDVRVEYEGQRGPIALPTLSGPVLLGLVSLYDAPHEVSTQAISEALVYKLDRAGFEEAAARFPQIRTSCEKAIEEIQRVRPIRD
jgi:CRP-like cAMP-binding protein